MNKTPVSMLQEMMVKKHMVPNYELVHDGGGTHDNTFVYQVACDGLSAMGKGRSKKEAKHEAAKAMLRAIAKQSAYPQLLASPAQSPARSALSTVVPVCPKTPANEPFVNAIGDLKAICCDNNIGEPRYELISDVGPPHERIFTYHCIVATFKEEAAATTKKQAKHEAAKKMLQRIQAVLSNMSDKIHLQELAENSLKERLLSTQKAINIFPELSKTCASKKIKLGLKIATYHTAIRDAYTEEVRNELKEKFQSFIPTVMNTDSTLIDELLPKMNELLEPLDLVVIDKTFSTKLPNETAIGLAINTDPILIEVAVGEEKNEVMRNVILKLINKIIFFIQ